LLVSYPCLPSSISHSLYSSTIQHEQSTDVRRTAPVSFFSWKLIKRTRLLKATEVDLVWERPTIDAYELTFMDPPNTFWGEMLGPLKFGKMKKSSDRQMSVGGV
jgi:hypothetical protein